MLVVERWQLADVARLFGQSQLCPHRIDRHVVVPDRRTGFGRAQAPSLAFKHLSLFTFLSCRQARKD